MCVLLRLQNFILFMVELLLCGRYSVKFHEMSSLQDTPSVITLDAEAERMDYSADGQLLAVATRGGSVSVFLSKLPMLAAAHSSRVALLSSLTQITVYHLPFEKVLQSVSIIFTDTLLNFSCLVVSGAVT